ncbi:MAG TPA: aminomethyl-transferring glycine dehydrogenase [Candidatus Limnocylindrales bacterium]|nr:aminomethyl-transferring glycine dehydrogenase [Candidatus Limnocylindrales bacterium]
MAEPAATEFVDRHVGPDQSEVDAMLAALGRASMNELIGATVPAAILRHRDLDLPGPRSEVEALDDLRAMAAANTPLRPMIGMGYHDTITPPVIQRNVLENPAWYTAYTPYQPEIAQGRLEALINFQTAVTDLTGMEIANASMLDEGTAAAEAVTLCHSVGTVHDGNLLLVDADTHPQTIGVIRTRAEPHDVQVLVAGVPELLARAQSPAEGERPFAILLSSPGSSGEVRSIREEVEAAHAAGLLVIVATDPLAAVLLESPGAQGADVVVGSSQRFGVPMGNGGPHAAFMATRDVFKRSLPGRLVGVSIDADGAPAYRLTLQTREQHIRREKATSNICTAQVLLAVIASMYAAYHGPAGLREIAERVHRRASAIAAGVSSVAGLSLRHDRWFDTIAIETGTSGRADSLLADAAAAGYELRRLDPTGIAIACDETTTEADVAALVAALGGDVAAHTAVERAAAASLPKSLRRTDAFLSHPVFNLYRSETEMLRYIFRLAEKDVTLTRSMIPLGSCTMKLNATTEMMGIGLAGFSRVHPFSDTTRLPGYARLYDELERWLGEITGFPAVSLQPNAGSQGEFAGLLAIRGWHRSRGEGHRRVCLIPASAHGTNPASAVMAGYRVVVVVTDDHGNVDLDDLRAKIAANAADLGALMITYPSTHGVFEEAIVEICRLVHEAGGQVYMDGANMNAQVGLSRPADIGADVCHLNLHKTFAIPHGGGGPGMGPIGVAAHLRPFLPGIGLDQSGRVSSAPYGSASILPISWAYVAMLGADGVRRATQVAILNANYLAARLGDAYPVLYRGANGTVAHECILDCLPVTASSGVTVDDIAKRLMDFGFHAPTMSFPVAGTLMIEPTESESKAELDRFADALLAIRAEIADVEAGRVPLSSSALRNAPHTAADLLRDEWARPYTREQGAYPAHWVRARKYWPPVRRIDNVYGDRNVVCECLPVEAYAEAAGETQLIAMAGPRMAS